MNDGTLVLHHPSGHRGIEAATAPETTLARGDRSWLHFFTEFMRVHIPWETALATDTVSYFLIILAVMITRCIVQLVVILMHLSMAPQVYLFVSHRVVSSYRDTLESLAIVVARISPLQQDRCMSEHHEVSLGHSRSVAESCGKDHELHNRVSHQSRVFHLCRSCDDGHPFRRSGDCCIKPLASEAWIPASEPIIREDDVIPLRALRFVNGEGVAVIKLL